MQSTLRAIREGDADTAARDLSVDIDATDIDATISHHTHLQTGSLYVLDDLLTRALRRSCNCLHVEPDRHFWRLRYRAVDGLEEELLHDPQSLADALAQLENLLCAGTDRDTPRHGCCRIRIEGHILALRIDVLPACNGRNYRIELYPDPARAACLDSSGMTAAQLRMLRQLLNRSEGRIIVAGTDRVQRSMLLDALTADLTSPDRRILSLTARIHPYLPRTVQLVIEDLAEDSQITLCRAALEQEFDAIVLHRPVSTPVYEALASKAAQSTLMLEGLEARGRRQVLRLLRARVGQSPSRGPMPDGLIIQHQLRRLCQACCEPSTPHIGLRRWLSDRATPACHDIAGWLEELGNDGYFAAPGCEVCYYTGYDGLIPVFDIVVNASAIDALLNTWIPEAGQSAQPDERLTRRVMALAQRGDTTLAEAVRVLRIA